MSWGPRPPGPLFSLFFFLGEMDSGNRGYEAAFIQGSVK